MKIPSVFLATLVATGSWALDVSGTITDGRGAPLGGVTLTLRQGATARTATSNGSGSYTFTGLSAASYSVVPSASGRFFSPESVYLSSLASNRTVNFEGTSTSTAWAAMDVGSVPQAGTTVATPTGIRMTGYGTGMDRWPAFDDHLHTYTRAFAGDGEIVAKVTSFSGGGEDARFGIVFRESMAPSARFAAFAIRPFHPKANERLRGFGRQTPGKDAPWSCQNSCWLSGMSPMWIKAVRQGSQFLFSYSFNGTDWTYQGFQNVPMGRTLRVGLFVAGDDGTPQTAEIEQISVASNAAPTVSVSASATSVAAGSSVTLSATAADVDGSVRSVGFFVNGERIGSSLQSPYQTTWNTAGLPAGRYLVMAKVLDDKGAQSYSGNLPVVLTGSVPSRPVALLLVRSTPLAPQDVSLRDRLNALGFSVVVKTDVAATLQDTAGTSLIVAGPTVSSAGLGTKFLPSQKPVLVLNPALYPAFQMAGATSGTHFGWTAANASLKVTGCDGSYLDWNAQGNTRFSNETIHCHELSAGLFGSRQVQRAARAMAWAKPAGSAKVAAVATDDASKALVFGYEKGASLINGTAAAGRRVGLWMDSLATSGTTDLGLALFDAAAYWAAGLRTPITKKVFVLNFDPVLESKDGLRTHAYKGWNDPVALTRDYLNDLTEASGGYVRWKLVDFRHIDGSPRLEDGTFMSDEQVIRAVDSGKYPAKPSDYNWIADQYGLDALVAAGQVDEVVMWSYPGTGFCESRMAGPTPYWVNCSELQRPNSRRNYILMGLNYERNFGEALESFGHRVESILSNATGGWTSSGDCDGKPDFRDRSLWDLYTNFQRNTSGGTPAGVGNVHYPPTSPQDYDWDPRWTVVDGIQGPWRTTYSYADDWARNFPYLDGTNTMVDTRTWDPNGGADGIVLDRNYKKWWHGHLPRVLGTTLDGTPTERKDQVARGFPGARNNWWDYIVDFNAWPESRGPNSTVGCLPAFDLPAAPYGLAAVGGDAWVDVSWGAMYGATSYTVEISAGGQIWSVAGTSTTTSLRVTGLANGTTYSLRVRTTTDAGMGLPGEAVTATPTGANPEPCSPARVVSNNNTQNFNTTGSVCLKTSEAIHGWGCSNFDGRTLKVNGVTTTCGQMPLAAPYQGWTYFEATSGAYPWASIYWW